MAGEIVYCADGPSPSHTHSLFLGALYLSTQWILDEKLRVKRDGKRNWPSLLKMIYILLHDAPQCSHQAFDSNLLWFNKKFVLITYVAIGFGLFSRFWSSKYASK